jgi:hypothetical protein
MTGVDYLGVALAFAVGIVCVVFRKRIAVAAVEQHARLYGARWDPRAFELCFGIGGIIVIAWGLFVLLGALVFAD